MDREALGVPLTNRERIVQAGIPESVETALLVCLAVVLWPVLFVASRRK